uniref:Uncharacterized protein n=1 Tax=Lepeophtheirus salmonis TaxID=72036 RepID=A0A0K2UBJ0_LEPSM
MKRTGKNSFHGFHQNQSSFVNIFVICLKLFLEIRLNNFIVFFSTTIHPGINTILDTFISIITVFNSILQFLNTE